MNTKATSPFDSEEWKRSFFGLVKPKRYGYENPIALPAVLRSICDDDSFMMPEFRLAISFNRPMKNEEFDLNDPIILNELYWQACSNRHLQYGD